MNTLSPKKILFYVDGELESGWGHLRRSEALAYEAKARGWEVLFLDTGPRASQWLQERSWNVVAVSAETDASVLVIDSYLITSEMIAEYKKRYTYVVGFHDFGAIDERFDLVISSVLTGESTQAATTIIAGASYRTIHPDVLSQTRHAVSRDIARVVVTLGASPATTSLSRDIALRISQELPTATLDIVAGMSGSDAATAFAHADIAISAGGQTMLELLYLGVPTVVVITSPDQESQVQDALSQKAIAGALKIDNPSLLDDLAKALQGLYSWDTRNALSATASSYIDDRGAERIFNTIEKSLHEKV